MVPSTIVPIYNNTFKFFLQTQAIEILEWKHENLLWKTLKCSLFSWGKHLKALSNSPIQLQEKELDDAWWCLMMLPKFLDDFAWKWRWNGWWIDDGLMMNNLLSVKFENDVEKPLFHSVEEVKKRKEKLTFLNNLYIHGF